MFYDRLYPSYTKDTYHRLLPSGKEYKEEHIIPVSSMYDIINGISSPFLIEKEEEGHVRINQNQTLTIRAKRVRRH